MLTDATPNTQAGEIMGGAASTRPLSTIVPAAGQTGDAPVIALEGVHKRFNDIYALRNVSISIESGEVFSLLGPTGSGKSTLVKLLLGFLQPDEGTVSLFGTTDPRSVAARIGYMPERPYFHHNFTGRD